MSETHEQKVSQGMLTAGTKLVRELREMTAKCDSARETVRKFTEAVELMARGPDFLCGMKAPYATKLYCRGCKMEPLCAIAKESEG